MANEFYSVNHNPLLGVYKINLFNSQMECESIQLHYIFFVYPFLNDNRFLEYIEIHCRTKEIYKLISNYIIKEYGKEFYSDYRRKYEMLRGECLESIILGLQLNIFEMTEIGIKNKEHLSKNSYGIGTELNKKILKLGQLFKEVSITNVMNMLKIGEINDKN
ncbi:MAG: hypothetical protein VB122_04740 [Erysipelotrichales bacterium]|nr:hypothetical protein [Erysipelotrichales bacterium]